MGIYTTNLTYNSYKKTLKFDSCLPLIFFILFLNMNDRFSFGDFPKSNFKHEEKKNVVNEDKHGGGHPV